MRLYEIEKMTGEVADFLVYYTRNGKKFVDCLYEGNGATSEEAARKVFKKMAKELGWKAEITRVTPRVIHVPDFAPESAATREP